MDANNEKELSTNYVEEDEPMKKNNKKLAKAARSAVAVGFAVGGITAVESFDAYAADGVDDGAGEEEIADKEDNEFPEPEENDGDTEGGKEADGDTDGGDGSTDGGTENGDHGSVGENDGTGSEAGASTDAGGPSDETDAASGETQDQVGTQTEQQAETPDAQSSHDAGQEQQGPAAPEGYHEVSEEHAGEPGTIGKYYKSEESTDGNVKPANQEITEQEFKELNDQADANGRLETGTEYYADHNGVVVPATEKDYNAGTKLVGTDYYKYSEDNPDHHETIGPGEYDAAIANGGVLDTQYFKQEQGKPAEGIEKEDYNDLLKKADQDNNITTNTYTYQKEDAATPTTLTQDELDALKKENKAIEVDNKVYIITGKDYFIDGKPVVTEDQKKKYDELVNKGAVEGKPFNLDPIYVIHQKDADGNNLEPLRVTKEEAEKLGIIITDDGNKTTITAKKATTYSVNGGDETTDPTEYNKEKSRLEEYVGEGKVEDKTEYYCYEIDGQKHFYTKETASALKLLDSDGNAHVKVGTLYQVDEGTLTKDPESYNKAKAEIERYLRNGDDQKEVQVDDGVTYYLYEGLDKQLHAVKELPEGVEVGDNIVTAKQYTVREGNSTVATTSFDATAYNRVKQDIANRLGVSVDEVQEGDYYLYTDKAGKECAILKTDRAVHVDEKTETVSIKNGKDFADGYSEEFWNKLAEFTGASSKDAIPAGTYHFKGDKNNPIFLHDNELNQTVTSYESYDGTTEGADFSSYDKVKKEIAGILNDQNPAEGEYWIFNDKDGHPTALTKKEATERNLDFSNGQKIYYVNGGVPTNDSKEYIEIHDKLASLLGGEDKVKENTQYVIYKDAHGTEHAIVAGQADDNVSTDANGNLTEKPNQEKTDLQTLLNNNGLSETVQNNTTYYIYKDADGVKAVSEKNASDEIKNAATNKTKLYYINGKLYTDVNQYNADKEKYRDPIEVTHGQGTDYYYTDPVTGETVHIDKKDCYEAKGEKGKGKGQGQTNNAYSIEGTTADGKKKTVQFDSDAPIILSHDNHGYYFVDEQYEKVYVDENAVYAAGNATINPTFVNTEDEDVQDKAKKFLDSLTITTNFDIYADTVNESCHIDGNIATNHLHGKDGNYEVEAIKASGAEGKQYGIGKYSIIKNEANEPVQIKDMLYGGVVVGTNITGYNLKHEDQTVFEGGDNSHNFEGYNDKHSYLVDVLKDGVDDDKSTKEQIVEKICEKAGANKERVQQEYEITENLKNIAKAAQDLIDAAKDKALDLVTGITQHPDMEENEVMVLNITRSEYAPQGNDQINKQNSIFDKLEEFLKHNDKVVGARVIINVLGLDENNGDPEKWKDLNANETFNKFSGAVIWNYGSYSGTVHGPKQGVIVAANAAVAPPESRDGGIIAKSINQTMEVHKSRVPALPTSTDHMINPIADLGLKYYTYVKPTCGDTDVKTQSFVDVVKKKKKKISSTTGRVVKFISNSVPVSVNDVKITDHYDEETGEESLQSKDVERTFKVSTKKIHKQDDTIEVKPESIHKNENVVDDNATKEQPTVTISSEDHKVEATKHTTITHLFMKQIKVDKTDIRKPVFKRTKFITLADYYFQPDKPDTPDTPDTPHEDHDTPDTPGDHDDHDTPDTPSNDEGKVLGVRRDKPDEGKVLGATREKPEVLGVNRHVQTSDSGEMAKNGLFASIGAFVLAVWAKLNKKSKKV